MGKQIVEGRLRSFNLRTERCFLSQKGVDEKVRIGNSGASAVESRQGSVRLRKQQLNLCSDLDIRRQFDGVEASLSHLVCVCTSFPVHTAVTPGRVKRQD